MPDSELVSVTGKVAQMQNGSVRWHHVLQAESGSIRTRLGRGTVKISGVSSPAPPKLCASWMTKCASNNALGDAVTLIGGGSDWYDLYKVWEVLKGTIGTQAIIDKDWASKKDLSRLRQTINHYRHFRGVALRGTFL
jgi:hypothetical protein